MVNTLFRTRMKKDIIAVNALKVNILRALHVSILIILLAKHMKVQPLLAINLVIARILIYHYIILTIVIFCADKNAKVLRHLILDMVYLLKFVTNLEKLFIILLALRPLH